MIGLIFKMKVIIKINNARNFREQLFGKIATAEGLILWGNSKNINSQVNDYCLFL
jgi:hypothetical protein